MTPNDMNISPELNLFWENGFKSLEFWGIAPTVLFKKCTTVFYKSNNCLKV